MAFYISFAAFGKSSLYWKFCLDPGSDILTHFFPMHPFSTPLILRHIFLSIFIWRVTCYFDNIILIWWVVFRLNVESLSVDSKSWLNLQCLTQFQSKNMFLEFGAIGKAKVNWRKALHWLIFMPSFTSRTRSVLLQTFLKFYLEKSKESYQKSQCNLLPSRHLPAQS